MHFPPHPACAPQVFDGDIPYLYKQSRTNRIALEKGQAGKEWAKSYYLPGQSDR